jgi:sodium transport system ATP-binding protein
MIEVHNLCKSYHGRRAVDRLSFQARSGTITGLLGSNGAGKSTALRMIAGVLTPESGTIVVDGEARTALDRRRRVGALLDHLGLYARLTVRENLAYFGRLRGMPPGVLAERVEALIATLGMQSAAGRRTAGFSQGERMKTALGRALLHAPGTLLLDEPTSGLDVPTVRSLRDLLRRLRDEGVCILFSSHVLDEVRALCDHVLIIDGGRLMAQGTPAGLCAQTGTESLEDAFLHFTARREVAAC